MNITKEKMKIIFAMLIWGTIGVFVRQISLNSMEIAFFRAIIGSGFIFFLGLLTGKKFDLKSLKKNLSILVLSGMIISINWIFLFQGYKYTTISNATLSYYFAPVFIAILSTLVLKEKLSTKKALCILGAMIGLFLILKSGDKSDISSYNHTKGILYGLAGAVSYAIVIILNKFIKGLPSFDITLIQLFVAGIILLPFIIGQNTLKLSTIDIKSWIFIIVLGTIHTGIAFLLYFSAIREVEGQSIAVLSYIDPIFAVLISAIFLGESIGIPQIIGGVLILGSAYLSER